MYIFYHVLALDNFQSHLGRSTRRASSFFFEELAAAHEWDKIPHPTTIHQQKIVVTTMVKSRRSSQVKQQNPVDAFEERKRQRVLGVQAAGIHRLGRGTVECFSVLERLFFHATQGIWFRILPIDDHDDDICHGLGVEWRYLLPLLTKCGLIKSKTTSVVKDVHVGTRQWDEMAKALVGAMRMEITSIRTQYARRSYFFCVGQPRYQNPLAQEKALSLVGMVGLVPSRGMAPRDLALEAQKIAVAVLNDRLACRVQGPRIGRIAIEDQQQQQQEEGLNDDQVDAIAEAVHASIEYAVALDLERRPRLSRSNAGTSIDA